MIRATSGTTPVLFLLAVLLLVSGCTTTHRLPPLTDGKILSRAEVTQKLSQLLPGKSATLSAQNYLEVRAVALPALINAYRYELSSLGVGVSDVTGNSGWDVRFNCTDFTDLFLGFSGSQVMRQLWTSSTEGQKPAIFAVWYVRDKSPVPTGPGSGRRHSIVLVLTDKGPVFLDPQEQDPVMLSTQEKASAYHVRS